MQTPRAKSESTPSASKGSLLTSVSLYHRRFVGQPTHRTAKYKVELETMDSSYESYQTVSDQGTALAFGPLNVGLALIVNCGKTDVSIGPFVVRVGRCLLAEVEGSVVAKAVQGNGRLHIVAFPR